MSESVGMMTGNVGKCREMSGNVGISSGGGPLLVWFVIYASDQNVM